MPMKLFHQLTDEQKDAAIHYCLYIILHDVLEHGMHLDPPDDEEREVVETVMAAVEEAKQFTEFEDKVDHLMADDEVNSILHSAAHEMSLNCYYPGGDDMCIFEEEITPELEEEEEQIEVEKKMLN
jgi:hypothetical protein